MPAEAGLSSYVDSVIYLPRREASTLNLAEWFTIPALGEIFQEPTAAIGLMLAELGLRFKQGKTFQVNNLAYSTGVAIEVEREYEPITRWNLPKIAALIFSDADEVSPMLVNSTEITRVQTEQYWKSKLILKVCPTVKHTVCMSEDVLLRSGMPGRGFSMQYHAVFWNKLDAAKFLLLRGA